jgi:Ca2+-transporting ATPase
MSSMGLSSAEAHSRLIEEGENLIPTEKETTLVRQILTVISEPMLILLISAGAINFFLAEILVYCRHSSRYLNYSISKN